MAKVTTGAKMVKNGYGQVEPNHLSAGFTGLIYAQLPAADDIEILENGQFVKYDYAAGVCNFVGKGEWMLVMNEVKTYRDRESYRDFAMIKSDYAARVYSPVAQGEGNVSVNNYTEEYGYDMNIANLTHPAYMPAGTTMVPRVFGTQLGDIMTTNTINEEFDDLTVGDMLAVGDDGYLCKTAGTNAGTMRWQVVKKYTLADGSDAVKLMRTK